ncbi:MAG: Tim44 domain-containing protein [Nitrospirales bacterium]|nr:Tim44 domain-containing protein [Nitrospirales bacterium]
MRAKMFRSFVLTIAVLFVSAFVLEQAAEARVGGSRSFGSRGSNFSSPSRSAPYQRQQATQPPVQSAPMPQQTGGGFMRSLGGGLLGGLLGGMLFSSLGFAGHGAGMGGGGIGLIEILLVLGIGFLIFRMVKRKREQSYAYQPSAQQGYQNRDSRGYDQQYSTAVAPVGVAEADGLSFVRQMDPGFDEGRFKDSVMDIFFKIQGAWMNRDLSPVNGLLTEEMRSILQEDRDRLIREKRINRLENIAVRKVDITEVWQETGQDFITVLFYANLLDYTVDEATNEVVSGSRTEPVKFEEYWTFTRPVGNNPWRLSAIHQA